MKLSELSVKVPRVAKDSGLSIFTSALQEFGMGKVIGYALLRVANESRGDPMVLGDFQVYKRIRKGKTAYDRWIVPLLEKEPGLSRVPKKEFISYGLTQTLSLVFQRHLGDAHPAVLLDPRLQAWLVARGIIKAAGLGLTAQDLFVDTWAAGSYKRMPASHKLYQRGDGSWYTIADARKRYWGWAKKPPQGFPGGLPTVDVELASLIDTATLPDFPVPEWARGDDAVIFYGDGPSLNESSPEDLETAEEKIEAAKEDDSPVIEKKASEPSGPWAPSPAEIDTIRKPGKKMIMWEVKVPPGKPPIIRKFLV